MTAPVTEPEAPLLSDAANLAHLTHVGPWIADLHQQLGPNECQTTVDFDIPCTGEGNWYVQLRIDSYEVASPDWEGKLCDPCLAGWREWAAEEPQAIRVVSVTPVSSGD